MRNFDINYEIEKSSSVLQAVVFQVPEQEKKSPLLRYSLGRFSKRLNMLPLLKFYFVFVEVGIVVKLPSKI